MYLVSVCLFSCTALFVSISQVIGCEDRFRNDLYCVGWGIKLYSLTHSLTPPPPPVPRRHCSKDASDHQITRKITSKDRFRHLPVNSRCALQLCWHPKSGQTFCRIQIWQNWPDAVAVGAASKMWCISNIIMKCCIGSVATIGSVSSSGQFQKYCQELRICTENITWCYTIKWTQHVFSFENVADIMTAVYTVSQKKKPHWKNDTDVTHYRFNPHQPISVIFGRDVAEGVCCWSVIYYPTSPN